MAIKNSKTDPPSSTAAAPVRAEWSEVLKRPTVTTMLSDRQRQIIADWMRQAVEWEAVHGGRHAPFPDAQVLRWMIDWAAHSGMPADWRGYHPDAQFDVKKRGRK